MSNINFTTLGNQVKFIDSLKYHKQNLAKLANTIASKEKTSVKKLTEQFLCSRDYFGNMWSFLDYSAKQNVLVMVASGKGVIPYEKITDYNSLESKPEEGIFNEKSEFFSELKYSQVESFYF